jgi:hypothetical protein
MQERLRTEILQRQREKHERGETEWNWKDFEEMQYLTAVMKVFLSPNNFG